MYEYMHYIKKMHLMIYKVKMLTRGTLCGYQYENIKMQDDYS